MRDVNGDLGVFDAEVSSFIDFAPELLPWLGQTLLELGGILILFLILKTIFDVGCNLKEKLDEKKE